MSMTVNDCSIRKPRFNYMIKKYPKKIVQKICRMPPEYSNLKAIKRN